MNSKINYQLFAVSLSSLTLHEGESFYSLFEEFKSLIHSRTFDTGPLKRSAVKVQKLIDGWLSITEGMVHQRIIDFQEDFNTCFEFIRNLPKKINTFWQKKLRPWYEYARNLFTHKAVIASCAKRFETDQADILKRFEKYVATPEAIELMKTRNHLVIPQDEDIPVMVEHVAISEVFRFEKPQVSKSSSHALGKDPGVRAVLGIDESIENEVALTEAGVIFRKMVDEDPYGSYDKVLQIQKSTPPERSADPTKKTRLLAEEQMAKLYKKPKI